MGWFSDDEIGKQYKIILNDETKIIGILKKFDDIKVEVELEGGRVRKFRDEKIDDVEEINENRNNIESKYKGISTIRKRKIKIIKKAPRKEQEVFKTRTDLFPYLQHALKYNFKNSLETIDLHRKIIEPNIRAFLNIVKAINLTEKQIEEIYILLEQEEEYKKINSEYFDNIADLFRYIQNNIRRNFEYTCNIIKNNRNLLQDKLIEFSNLVNSTNLTKSKLKFLEEIVSINFKEIKNTQESFKKLTKYIDNEEWNKAENILERAYDKGHLSSAKLLNYLNILFTLNKNDRIISILNKEIDKSQNIDIKLKLIKQLSFYYSKMNKFNEALNILEKALVEFDINDEEKLGLLSQQVLIKIKSGKIADIENYLNKLEAIDSSNLMRQKVENLINTNQDYDDNYKNKIDTLIEYNIDYSTEFSNLDKFIKFYLESCTFSSISAVKKQNKSYTEGDYHSLSNLDRVKSSEGKADRTLTAVRIAEYLDIDEIEVNTKLIESIRYKANYYIQQGKFDIAKNYFLTILNQIEKTSKDQSYLKEILMNYLSAFLNKDFSIQKANTTTVYTELIDKNETQKLLINLRLFSKKAFDLLYAILKEDNELFKKYETKYSIEKIKNSKNLYEKIELDLKTIATKGIDNKLIIEILEKVDKSFLFNLDEKHFDTFKNVFVSFQSIFNTTRYEEKELTLERSKIKLEKLLESIEKEPTIFSINNLRELINRFLLKLEEYSLELKKSLLPKIIVSTPMETYTKISNTFEFHLNISNDKNLSPASNIKINLFANDKDISFKEINKLSGGESETLEIKLPAPEVNTFSIKVQIKYENILNERDIIEKDFAISFETEEDFKEIENPYFPDSDSVADKKMVYGRDELIDKLSNMLYNQSTKGIILYGQKRSGKTTVFKYLQEKMLEKNDKFFTIYFSMGEADSFESFIRNIVRRIKRDYKKQFNEKVFEFLEIEEKEINNLTSLFEFLEEVDDFLQKKELKLLILIDEFTYLYGYMKNGNYSESFLKNWKALIQRNLFKSALIGQNSMPLFINEYPNELAVYKKEPISYLDKESAIKLIIEPIMINNKSRYLENSEELIFEYTKGSPYYIQKICDRLVEYLNEKKSKYITKAHIKNVIELLFEKFTLEGDFDNLYSIGDGASDEIESLRRDMILQIGIQSKNIGSALFDDIEIDCSLEKKEEILKTLIDTNTIIMTNNRYKISVKLFEEFIQRNFNRG